MKVLVTGAAGFIGSWLCEVLLSQEHEVYGIDDLSTGSPLNLPKGDFYPNGRRKLFHFIQEDISKQYALLRNDYLKLDAIFHLAACVGVKRVLHNPVEATESNVRATQNVLDLAVRTGAKLLIASSSEVYGNRPDVGFLSEYMDLHIGVQQRWGYAAAKLIDEFTALAYHDELKLPVVVARIFNTIGPRQSAEYGMVVPTFIHQARMNIPITVHGGGRQKRSFTWVGDVADAMVKLLDTPAAYGEVVNIGSETEIEIGALAEVIKETVLSTSEIRFVPRAAAYGATFDEISHRRPDLTKIKALIGYNPTLTLKDMVRRILRQYEQEVPAQ